MRQVKDSRTWMCAEPCPRDGIACCSGFKGETLFGLTGQSKRTVDLFGSLRGAGGYCVYLSTQTSNQHAADGGFWLQLAGTSYSSGLQLPMKNLSGPSCPLLGFVVGFFRYRKRNMKARQALGFVLEVQFKNLE